MISERREPLLILAGGLAQRLSGDIEGVLRGDELGSREVESRLGLFDVGDRDQPDLEPLPALRELLLERLQGRPCKAELVIRLQHPEIPFGDADHEILARGGVERIGPRDSAVGLFDGNAPIATIDWMLDIEDEGVGSVVATPLSLVPMRVER